MSLPKHLEEAAARLEEASFRVAELRSRPPTLEGLQAWLAALTDYCEAISEVQRLDNQSIHEKLHAIAGLIFYQ